MYTRSRVHRDTEQEALERDRYIVMLHLYTLCADGEVAGVPRERIARDLALSEAREETVVDDLLRAEMATHAHPGIAPTRKGIDYLMHGARRRRSIRLERQAKRATWAAGESSLSPARPDPLA